jgi:hypothetical protein
MVTILDWLGGGTSHCRTGDLVEMDELGIESIIVPSLTNGLQGFLIGLFVNLQTESKPLITNVLREIADTIGEKYASVRRLIFLESIGNATSLAELAQAFISLLPPVRYMALKREGEIFGLRLNIEEDYLGGYEAMTDDEIADTICDNDICTKLSIRGSEVEVYFDTLTCGAGFDPYLASLRAQANLREVASRLTDDSAFRSVIRSELERVRASLLSQLGEERGAISACRNLYLVDSVYRHYARGEVILTNNQCRAFMSQKLKRDMRTGFHIAGKATKKYAADIARLLNHRLAFEAIGTTSLRIRWQPQNGPDSIGRTGNEAHKQQKAYALY